MKRRCDRQPKAKTTVAAVQEIGVKKVVTLTRDRVCRKKIALQAEVTDCCATVASGECQDYNEAHAGLRHHSDGPHRINEAPVLGIALGTAGNDIAIEAADVALMGFELRAMPYLIRLLLHLPPSS